MHARKIARIAVKRKNAVQKIAELSPLISLLKRRKLRTVVEIGTAKGGTLYVWCKIAQPNAMIVSIDMPGGPFGGGYTLRDMKTFRTYKKKFQKLFFLRKDAHRKSTVCDLEKKLNRAQIDLLFIDGDHRYKGVQRDFQLYSPLVKNNGIIVLHDILPHPEVPQCKVEVFWREIRNEFPHRELKKQDEDWGWGQWGGIGVLFFRKKYIV